MKTLINRITSTDTGLDTLPLRVGAGVIFAAPGAQKLFGWFGGYGLEGTAGWMPSPFRSTVPLGCLAGAGPADGGNSRQCRILRRLVADCWPTGSPGGFDAGYHHARRYRNGSPAKRPLYVK